jgi:hypothetical protein
MRAIALVIALTACRADKDSSSSDGGGTDTGSTTEDDPMDFVLEVTMSETLSTVGTLEWSMNGTPNAAWAEFGIEDYEHSVEVDLSSGDGWETLLLGMKADHDYDVRVRAVVDGTEYTSNPVTASTGSPPSGLPSLTVESTDNSETQGGYFLTLNVASPAAAVIFDADGDYVWWHLWENETEPQGSVKLSLDKRSLAYFAVNVIKATDVPLTRVALSGEKLETIDTVNGHHDFTELPDGTIAHLAFEEQVIEGHVVDGDVIVEIAPDGSTSTVYNIWDEVEYDASEDTVPGSAWSHANTLQYDADEDAYYMGFLGFSAIHKVDRSTGERLWTLGGEESDFATSAGSSDLFTMQHVFHRLEDSIVLFDNGSESNQDSRGVEYSFESDNSEVEVLWEYSADPALYCYALGNVQRLDGGNTLVVFSVSGRMDEVTPEGEVVWSVSASLGGVFGYTTYLNSLY